MEEYQENDSQGQCNQQTVDEKSDWHWLWDYNGSTSHPWVSQWCHWSMAIQQYHFCSWCYHWVEIVIHYLSLISRRISYSLLLQYLPHQIIQWSSLHNLTYSQLLLLLVTRLVWWLRTLNWSPWTGRLTLLQCIVDYMYSQSLPWLV